MLYNIQKLKKKLKPGDVFLVHGTHLISRIIRIVTDSHWNHATIYIGNGKFIEANERGVTTRDIAVYKQKDIEIYRHVKATDHHRKLMVSHAMQKTGKQYDFFQLLQLFFYVLFGIRGNAREIGSKNRYICSELVAEAYQATGLKVYKTYNPTQISPNDFTESDQFKLCVQRKNVLMLK